MELTPADIASDLENVVDNTERVTVTYRNPDSGAVLGEDAAGTNTGPLALKRPTDADVAAVGGGNNVKIESVFHLQVNTLSSTIRRGCTITQSNGKTWKVTHVSFKAFNTVAMCNVVSTV